MIHVITIFIRDEAWPELTCNVIEGKVDDFGLLQREIPSVRKSGRQSLYDTATSNFTPLVQNALMFTVRDIIAARKDPHGQSEEAVSPAQEQRTPKRKPYTRRKKAKKKGVRAH